MNLKDMLEKLEEIENSSISEVGGEVDQMVQDIDDRVKKDKGMPKSSSNIDQAVARATGVNVQRGERGREVIAKRQDQASKDVSQELKLLTFMKSNPNFLSVLKKAQDQMDAMEKEQEMSNMADNDSDYRADRMDNVDTEIDDSIDYDLLDLQDIEESPSAMAQKYAKTSGQSAQQLQRGLDTLGQRKDVASQGAGKLASDMDRLLNSKFAPAVMRMLDALNKEQEGNPEPDRTAMMQSAESIEEALQNPEVLDVLKEFTADVSLPILQDIVGGDKVLAQNAKIALRNIDADKGINKRFMPAVRKLLSKLTDMLASGGMGALAQFDQLHSQHTSGESPEVGTGGIADPDAVQDPSDIEFSDEEVMAWAKEKGLPVTSGDQIASAREQMKQEKMAKQADEPTSDEPGDRPKDNTGRPLNMQDESIQKLKQLAGLEEAMSDAYGVVPSEDKLEGSVEYKQHKNNDKGSVSVEASAETMDDLHDILKLAGVDMAMDLNKTEKGDDEDHDHDQEPKEPVEPEAPCDADEPKDKKVMVISPNDASYSTDKEVLVNYLKDKLKKSIS